MALRTWVLSPVKNEIELLDICINRPHTKCEKMYLEMMEFALGKMTYEKFVEKSGTMWSD